MVRRLTAILAADVVGYSRLMEKDEAGTLAALKAHRAEVIDPLIAEHGGRIVKLMGDGALVEFGSVVDAVACAVAVQEGMAERNTDVPADRRIAFRIGVNLGDVIVEGDDIYGDGVNVAARLEALAEPGGIALSGYAHDQVAGKLEAAFEDAGEHELKNISRPIRVWRWSTNASMAPSTGAKPKASTPSSRPSIAVLPFTNMSGDPEQEYFSDGITEDIITELSRFRSLFVIARNSTFAFKGQAVDVKEVGQKLGVNFVVEGSVRKAGQKVRITAQLIDTANGSHIWAERYDRDLEDIFVVQDEVTHSLVSIVAGRLADPSRSSQRQHPESMTAYELVLRGKQHFHHNTKTENARARELFQKAIDLDPEYALAHVWLGWTHCYDYELGWADDPEAAAGLALASSKRAVELDGSDAWAQAALAYCYMYARQFDRGETHIERAYKLNPNDSDILSQRGLFLTYLSRPNEGLESLEMAQARNPFKHDSSLWNLGICFYTLQQHEKALAAWREMPETPTEVFACLAASYAHLGMKDEAQRNMAEFLERSRHELAHYPGDDGAEWLAYWYKSFPYKNAEDFENLIDGLRKAGLTI